MPGPSRKGRAVYGRIAVAPSILSADFMNFERDVRMLEQAGADYVHVDVMDGHFVPNLTMGVPFVKQLAAITDLPLDVHLMISNPLEQLPWYLEAKPEVLTVHLEALEGPAHVRQAIDMIHAAGSKAALALKPDLPIEAVAPYIVDLDMVLVMSVFPGFSGQSYIEGSEERVAQVAALARKDNPGLLIEVDGGVSPERTAGLVVAAGADVLVAGSGVFKAADKAKAVADIREAARSAAAFKGGEGA